MDTLKYFLCTTDTHLFCYVCSQSTVGPMALSIFYQKEPRLRSFKVTSSYRINYNLCWCKRSTPGFRSIWSYIHCASMVKVFLPPPHVLFVLNITEVMVNELCAFCPFWWVGQTLPTEPRHPSPVSLRMALVTRAVSDVWLV